MKHRRPQSERATPSEAPSSTDEPVADDDGASLGHGPHHDPSVHAERESFAVTTQRCRGEYP
jgi:hypothetical protein